MNTLPWKNATPEQINLWNGCNGLIAWVPPITQLYYQGAIAGSEFLTYNAGKLYIALQCKFGKNLNIAGIGGTIEIHVVADAISEMYGDNALYWDVTAAAVKFISNALILDNLYFYRIVASQYAYMSFNGYRLNT